MVLDSEFVLVFAPLLLSREHACASLLETENTLWRGQYFHCSRAGHLPSAHSQPVPDTWADPSTFSDLPRWDRLCLDSLIPMDLNLLTTYHWGLEVITRHNCNKKSIIPLYPTLLQTARVLPFNILLVLNGWSFSHLNKIAIDAMIRFLKYM